MPTLNYNQPMPVPKNVNTSNSVDHPAHYNTGQVEVIDAIEAWGLDFCAGNVVKYVARHLHKGSPREDLEKARWYIDRMLDRLPDRTM